jgi:hypothetical protein
MDNPNYVEKLGLKVEAYNKVKKVSEILDLLTEEETKDVFTIILEEMAQEGRI